MPKFPKGFGRRKSSTNAFEDIQDAPPAEGSFRVFERPHTASMSFDGGVKLTNPAARAARPTTAPKEDNMFASLNGGRGSGASNTNTVSTADDSSRLSATSTSRSSASIPRHEDTTNPYEKSSHDIPIPPEPKSTNFSLKAAGRTLSWGRTKPSAASTSNSFENQPTPPPSQGEVYGRPRTVTESSYASTATPPKLDDNELGLNLGGDFGDMFSGFGKRASAILRVPLPEPSRAASPPDNPIPRPPPRTHTSNRPTQLAPIYVDRNREIEAPPYSLNSQNSQDKLIPASSPPQNPAHPSNAPPVPPHKAFPASPENAPSRPQMPTARLDSGFRRNVGGNNRKQVAEPVDVIDETALLKESILASQRLEAPPFGSKVRDSWALPPSTTYSQVETSNSSWSTGSVQTTPRANPRETAAHVEDIFDQQIMAAADIAQRYEEQRTSSPAQGQHNRVMTAAQFAKYRQDQDRRESYGEKIDSDSDDEPYEEEEDEIEKSRKAAKQRRQQEAHMSVYRQQMMKVTGEASSTPGTLRPGLRASQSTPNTALPSASEGEDEDDDVPLAILAAHNFPSKTRPPMRSVGSNPNLRASVAAGQPVGSSGGHLPIFARHLPQDPYLGAGLVHPTNRESLAFGAGSVAGSVQGDFSRAPIPGGLVGVIANEERSRALRRGSPAPPGNFLQQPAGFNGVGIPPQYPHAGGMMNAMGPTGPANYPMFAPNDPNQVQMAQQMQAFMQMQMQFMEMMTNGQVPTPNNQPPQLHLGDMPFGSQNGRPSSSYHQRSMTMMETAPPQWQPGMGAPSTRGPGGNYAASIAPSERSNVGLPGRYRPVSQMPAMDKSRTSTMSGALGNWDKPPAMTIKAVKKTDNISDEDDEEGWEEMKKKREKKRSLWRTKKDTNELKEMLGYT